MKHIAPLLLAVVAACGPAQTEKPSAAAPAVVPTAPPPVAKAPPTPRAVAVAPARVTVVSPALEVWLDKHNASPKTTLGKQLPRPVRTGLTSLAVKLSSAGHAPRLRWARPLGPDAVAFSYSVPPAPHSLPTYEFAVAIPYPGKSKFGVHSAAEGSTKPEGTNDWKRGKQRDIDGDGILDEIIHYEVGIFGGGDNVSRGSILLGSRGGALRLDLASTDSSYEPDGGCDNKSEEPAVMCWTTMDKRPLLLAIVAATDHCAKTKRPTHSYAAVRAKADGTLIIDDVFATVKARGTRAAMKKKRTELGARTQMPAPKSGDYDAAGCGTAPLMVPHRASYALISEFSRTRPAGDSVLFHLPGNGAGLTNVGRLGIKAPYTPKAPWTDKDGASIAPGAKYVEFVASDGAILGGTLWSTNDKNQTTIIMVNGDGDGDGDGRYGWMPIIRHLASRRGKKPPRARVLAIDIRGQGVSTRSVAGGTLDRRDFADKDWHAAVADVKAAIRYARSLKPVGRIALVGASFGATLVAHAAVDKNTDRVVLLSPRAKEKGLSLAPAYKTLMRRSRRTGRPPFMVFSAADSKSKALHKSLGGGSIHVRGNAKGTDLLSEKRARNAIQKALLD